MKNQLFNLKAIGRRINSLRVVTGLSLSEFAKEIGVSRGKTVGMWERGLSAPSLESAISICNRFNVSVDELVFGTRTHQTY